MEQIGIVFQQLHAGDYALMIMSTMVISLLGMVTPVISRYLYGELLEYRSTALLVGAILTLLCIALAQNFIQIMKGVLNSNISIKMNMAVETAERRCLL